VTSRTVRVALGGAVGLLALASAVSASGTPSNSGCPSSATTADAATSVVEVLAVDGRRVDTATGISVGPERVLTVAHPLATASDVRVEAPGTSDTLAARLVTIDARRDLAVLEVPGLRLSALRPSNGDAVDASCATVLAARDGRVVPLAAVVRRSVQVSIDAPVKARRAALELAVSIRRGDSGSPVLDGSGRVEGMVFAVSGEGPPTGWAVDASELRGLLDASAFVG
jgi:S1-C subfamily serine protease